MLLTASPVFIRPRFMIYFLKFRSMYYRFLQCLCYETVIVEPKYFFLNRRVFIKSIDQCILKICVFVYISLT